MPPTAILAPQAIVYPESDGKPMANNTKQFDWILKIAGNLKILVRDMDNVFASGNQFWYPVEGHPEIVQAPGAYVVFGRPRGDRPSYKQWEEDGIPMTVVFEVLSPGNTVWEMDDKLDFYDEHGVEEYYFYDPDSNRLSAWVRQGTAFRRVRPPDNHQSPRLGIRFDLSGPEMVIRFPDGRPFFSVEEIDRQRREAEQRADKAEQHASKEADRADKAEERLTRISELSGKLLAGQASEEEKQELARLIAPPQ